MKVFVESNEGYLLSDFFSTESEKEFLLDKELILLKPGNRFVPLFVGEVITPEDKYFSLPKNFEPTDDNVSLFKEVLKRYKKNREGKTLLTNNKFTISKAGKIVSEKYYFEKLKEYFLDYVTYEFIYPKKPVKTHSKSPISGGKVDVRSTIRNRKRFGPGITYNIKDAANDDSWILDDIYWTVIDELSNKYSNDNQIERMKTILDDEGYNLKKIDISDSKKMISAINKCETGIIHEPIKRILISYFESLLINESFSINVFYTKLFQNVWEQLVRDGLSHNEEFKKSLSDKFNRKRLIVKWFPNLEELNKYKSELKINDSNIQKLENGFRLSYEVNVVSIPDLFSEYNSKRFIGDAKYYKDPENSEYNKEFITYNNLTDNMYPMVVFVPKSRTRVLQYRNEEMGGSKLELIIISISVKDLINDAINNSSNTIERVHTLISKYTNRNQTGF